MAEIVFVLFVSFTVLFISEAYSSATFTLINNCEQTVWPGILSNAGVAPLSTTGFALQKGESRAINAPPSWGGRFWGRTHCSHDTAGKFTCVTGDCGSGRPECAGGSAAPPATLAEFTLDGHDGMDFYDVSLVDGLLRPTPVKTANGKMVEQMAQICLQRRRYFTRYNLPMLVAPRGGSGGNCTTTGCMADLIGGCPVALKLTSSGGQSVGCKSACEAFGEPHYCCSGAYQTRDTCKPSAYSEVFKNACPRAYSYAYDDKSSTFTCTGADYDITFCPPPDTRQKSSSIIGGDPGDGIPSVMDSTMVYEGASGSSIRSQAIYVAISIFVAMWLFNPTPI